MAHPSISDPKPGGESRSPEWPKVRGEHLKVQPTCQACGETQQVEVHHMAPFHLHPELELEDANLITLCEHPEHACHFLFGHLLDWRALNPLVEEDARNYLTKIENRAYE